jgi:hypothetical protein
MRTLLFSILLVIIFLTAGCRPEAPGEGSASAEGNKVTKPVIAALDKFKKDNGKYPAHLDELVPKYMPANPQRGPEGEIEYRYWPRDNGKEFSLGYSYRNFIWYDECIYDSERKYGVCGSKT